MRKLYLLTSALVLVGCGASTTTFVKSDTTTLGRVVVYRNGVAYFERYAQLEGDNLQLSVPADKVDDFLKSLTVVDAQTGQPAPVAYPTDVFKQGTSLIDMKVSLPGGHAHKLRVSYVTEAPAWKPSYRVVLGKERKVDLEAWAVVDNTSGEDWKDVKLGVGSSSALSFHFDLRSVRLVQRETLQANDQFAFAPPMGGASHGGEGGVHVVMTEMPDDVLQAHEEERKNLDAFRDVGAAPSATMAQRPTAPARPPPPVATRGGVGPNSPVQQRREEPKKTGDEAFETMARALRASNQQVIIEGYANALDGDKHNASLSRANRVREELVRQGVDPNNIVAVGRGEVAGQASGIRVVQAPPHAAPKSEKAKSNEPGAGSAEAAAAEPIGTSHFESPTPMTVARGSSAMVSILKESTDGEVVYLYDAESTRGNTQFPFRAVRIKNPTESTLESGPVTVFGDGRFIGEGLSEPIPAHSVAFVPFALDRQVVVDAKDGEHEEIEKVIAVQRGVFSTQVRHTRKTTLTLHNRLAEKATVYVRHTVPQGYSLPADLEASERLGGAHLFKVEIEPHGVKDLVIEEFTPIFKTADIRTPGGIELVKVFLSSAAMDSLKDKVQTLLKLQEDLGNYEQRVATVREQMGEYRQRMDELHGQILTLHLVKTGDRLMHDLEGKMKDMSDKLSQATLEVVSLEEKAMIARINFQDGVADLSIEKKEGEGATRTALAH